MTDLELSSDDYYRYAKVVDYDTMALSGGYERRESYRNLIDYGGQVFPYLIDQLQNKPSWWRMQMVCELAPIATQQCIYFDPEEAGRLEPVHQRVLHWWHNYGREAYFSK